MRKITAKYKHPLAPIYDQSSKILILGSFPSVLSREKGFYYANPSNRFWKVMEILFSERIDDHRAFCLKNKIALWDVIESCDIDGSNDCSIRNVRVNHLSLILSQAKITKVFLTGKKAYELYQKYISVDLPYVLLPSTSAANAKMRLNDLVEIYKVIRDEIESGN